MMVTPEEEAAFRAREDAEIAARRAKELEDERRYIQQSSGINYRKNEQDKFIFAAGKAPLSTQRACTSLPHPSASYNARSHEHDVTRIFLVLFPQELPSSSSPSLPSPSPLGQGMCLSITSGEGEREIGHRVL